MKLKMPKGYTNDPSDEVIERDVAELRALLDGSGAPEEPHPAYWQNFLVHVRGQIDRQQSRRKRRSMVTAWGSLTAAAVIAVVIVNQGMLTDDPGGEPARPAVASSSAPTASAGDVPLFAEGSPRSLVLSENDVKMVDAIVKGDDAAVFEAIVDSEIF